MNPIERKNLITQEFLQRFHQRPTVWVQAPGRVDLMGSHTDYNEGFVMTMTINRETWLALRPRDDQTVIIHSLNLPGRGTIYLNRLSHDRSVTWTNYVRGVAQILQTADIALKGFEGLIHSTIPFGSGLSSSAALEVATATAFNTLSYSKLAPLQLALLCQRAENEFVGMNCGILDQYSSALGQAGCSIVLDCRNLTHQVAPVPAEIGVVICDTRVKRALTGSEYPERRAQCEEGARRFAAIDPNVKTLRDVTLAQFRQYAPELPEKVARRSRFIIEENQRVLDLAAALARDDRQAIKTLTAASYAGARDLFEIVAPGMEMMMQAMTTAPGVIGARQAGAGFGGSMIAFVEKAHRDAFASHVAKTYFAAAGIQPEIYPVEPAPGAGVLQI